MQNPIADAIQSVNQRDPELGGQVGRALLKGHDFSYYLALLSPSIVDRLRVNAYDNGETTADDALTHPYRNPPLCANDEIWHTVQHNSEIAASQDTTQLRLWQCLHPDPLALADDPAAIEPEVTVNCEWGTQLRLADKLTSTIEAQPALLLDTIDESKTALV